MNETVKKVSRVRSRNFETSEINLLTRLAEKNINTINEKFSTNITNDKKRLVWEKITEEVNALGVANRSTKEIKTKWSNLHQEAKKSFTDFQREQKKTGGGPPPKPLSEASQRIVEIYKDCQSFTGLSGVESDSITTDISEDAVEIVGSPKTINLLSEYVKQIQNATLEGSVPSEVSAATPTPAVEPIIQAGCSNTCILPNAVVDDGPVIIDVKLDTELPKPAVTKSNRRIKPEDLTRMQYEVLEASKRKLQEQTTYYELMNKKLRLELANMEEH